MPCQQDHYTLALKFLQYIFSKGVSCKSLISLYVGVGSGKRKYFVVYESLKLNVKARGWATTKCGGWGWVGSLGVDKYFVAWYTRALHLSNCASSMLCITD